MEVAHGGFSQVECTFRLLRKAHDMGMDYFHLISGQDFPCRPNSEFDEFFEKNVGKSYMHFDSEEEHIAWTPRYRARIKSWLLLDLKHRDNPIVNKFVFYINALSFRFWWRSEIEGLRAGWNWFSWHRFVADYVLMQTKQNPKYFKRFQHTSGSDELIFHTLLYPRMAELGIVNDALRYIDWKHNVPGRTEPNAPLLLNEEDYDSIVDSGAFFCRKVRPDISGKLLEMLTKRVTAK